MASVGSERIVLAVLVAALGCGASERSVADRVEPPRATVEPGPERGSAHGETGPSQSGPPQADPPCTLVEPPPGFVDLREHIPSAIVFAGYHRDDNFTGARLPGYDAPGAWLAKPAAEALARAARQLETDGLRLIIYDAYRPRQASEAMVEWCRAHDRTDLLDDGWVAARSTHSRGLSIDVGLADAQGTALDMGSAWDQFDRRSYLHGVEGPALERRLRLRDELVRAGFEPYTREWWHFTFVTTSSAPARSHPYACIAAD